MGFDAGAVIRAGSGIAFIGVGVFAALGGRGTGRRAFGAMCGTFGLGFLVYNVLSSLGMNELGLAIEAVFLSFVIVGVVTFVLRGEWKAHARSNRETRIALAVTAAGAVFSFVIVVQVRNSLAGRLDTAVAGAMHAFLLLVAFLAARRAATRRDARSTRALAALAVGIAAYSSFQIGTVLAPANVPVFGLAFVVFAVVAVGSVAITWLAVASEPGGRASWIVAWGLGAAILAGMVDAGSATSGTVGIVRTVAALSLSLAIVGGALDNDETARVALRPRTLAAGALATLFIVAQIAQNFFSAEFGLLTGGIVAGAFLFAASPIQRAMERMGERRAEERSSDSPGPHRSRISDGARREEVYRRAVRVAMADHVVTRDEDVHLYELAEELGIGAGRAAQLRRDVEREAG